MGEMFKAADLDVDVTVKLEVAALIRGIYLGAKLIDGEDYNGNPKVSKLHVLMTGNEERVGIWGSSDLDSKIESLKIVKGELAVIYRKLDKPFKRDGKPMTIKKFEVGVFRDKETIDNFIESDWQRVATAKEYGIVDSSSKKGSKK